MWEEEILEPQIITDVISNLKVTHHPKPTYVSGLRNTDGVLGLAEAGPVAWYATKQDHELLDMPGQPKEKHNAVTVASDENGLDKINLTSFELI